jgi:O-antigen/teichoic acid export membrane protein
VSFRGNPGAFLGKFANAVFAQALLSAGSLIVSLILLRHGTASQYGYYVLVLNALLLLTSVQTTFVSPALVQELTRLESAERASFIGGLYRGQSRVLPPIALICVGIVGTLWYLQALDTTMALLLLVAVGAGWAMLYREFFRMVLNSYRLSGAVLRGDILYVATLVCGAIIGVLTPIPAVVTVGFSCLAALGGGLLLARMLWKHEAWNLQGAPGVWRQIAKVGAWTAAGGIIHWSFSQGYNYLIVGTLDVTAVAASAATRMLMMPVNLLSTGIGSIMLPTASAWMLAHGSGNTLRRLSLAAVVIAGAALLYLTILWLTKDFIFAQVLHKDFAQRDLLLVLWSMASLMMVVRDQVIYFMLARARYRSLTMLTLACAIVSLTVSYFMMLRIGVAGAPVGVLTGEICNVAGLVAMSLLEVQREEPQQATS